MSNRNLPARPYQPNQALQYLRGLPHLDSHPNLPRLTNQLPRVAGVWQEIDDSVTKIYHGDQERLYAGVTAVGGYFEAYRAPGDMTGTSYSTFFSDLMARTVKVDLLSSQRIIVSGPQNASSTQCEFSPPTPLAAPYTGVVRRYWLQLPLNNNETSPEDFFVSNGAERYYLADMPDLQANTNLHAGHVRTCLFLPSIRT